MKRMVLFTALFIGMATVKTEAQVRVNLNINIGSQPVWGPVGYDYVQYYYLPEIDVYYYVPSHQYVYLNGGRWIFASALPVRYRNYNLYSGYKVVINEPKAYLHHNVHVVNYAKYKTSHGKQVIIRDSPDPKYVVVKKKNNGNNKNKDEKHGNDHDKHKR